MVVHLKLHRYGTTAARFIASRSLVASFGSGMPRSDPIPADTSSSAKTKSTRAARLQKRLDVAIVGAPNAGKSQLLNALVGSKVAAVSRKRHTTRSGILGARTFGDTQLVFIDTPGFLHHKIGAKEGVRKLLGEASSEMDSADFTLLVVDAARKLDDDMKKTLITLMFLALRSRGRDGHLTPGRKSGISPMQNKFAVVLNKVDLVNPKNKLLLKTHDVGSMAESCIRRLLQQRRDPLRLRLGDLVDSVLETYSEEEGFDKVHDDDIETFAAVAPEFLFTSAIEKDDEGVDDVLRLLMQRATPCSQWIADPGCAVIMSPIEQVEEIIREKVYRNLHREVPHCVQQQNRIFRLIEANDGKSPSLASDKEKVLRIHQDLVVKTRSHQKLVLGSGGKTLERIRSAALIDLKEAFRCEVDLEMDVKISKLNRDVVLDPDGEGMSTFKLS